MAKRIEALLVTKGHAFERGPFLQVEEWPAKEF